MSDGYGSTVTTTRKRALLPTKFKEYHPILNTMICLFVLQIMLCFHSTIDSHDVWSKSWNSVSSVRLNWLVQPQDAELLIICHFRAYIWSSVNFIIMGTSLSWHEVAKGFQPPVSQFWLDPIWISAWCLAFRYHKHTTLLRRGNNKDTGAWPLQWSDMLT